MEYSNIIIENNSGIVTLTINRPKALNALNRLTIADIDSFFTEGYKEIEDLKGVIITGAGEKSFIAGADIKEFEGLDEEKGKKLSATGHVAFNKIENFHVTVIAAINGFSLGGGNELAMACHLRIAGEKARFGQPEAKLGLIPGYGATQRLVALIGKTKAMELLLTADMIGAEEAERLGLVNKVVPVGTEVEEATKMLTKIAGMAPLAVQETIRTVNAYGMPDRGGYQLEIEKFGHLMATEDFKEGASAFVEKRRAEFKGK